MTELNTATYLVRQNSDRLSADELRDYVATYQDMVLAEHTRFEVLSNEVRSLTMPEILGDQGKVLKSQLAECSNRKRLLEERLQVHLDCLGSQEAVTP